MFVVNIEGLETMERCYKGLKEDLAYGALKVSTKQTGKGHQNPRGAIDNNISEASVMKISDCGSNLAIGFSTGQARVLYLREDCKLTKESS